MANVIKEMIASYHDAVLSTRFIYALHSLQLADEVKESRLYYNLIGTGKTAISKRVLDVYNDEMLYLFNPKDIKIISTTATLIQNSPSTFKLINIDLNTASPTVAVRNERTGEIAKFPISELQQNENVLAKLDGVSGYILGKFST